MYYIDGGDINEMKNVTYGVLQGTVLEAIHTFHSFHKWPVINEH